MIKKNIFSFFYPEEVDFFSPMDRMYQLINQTLVVYIEAASKPKLTAEERAKLLVDLKNLEREGDTVVQSVTAGLKRTFTPPYSPGELRQLFSCLDDSLDLLYESAMTNITAEYRAGLPPFTLEQLQAFQRGIREAACTVDLMRASRGGSPELSATLTRMCDIETEGDRIYWRLKTELASALNQAAKSGDLGAYRQAEMDEKILDQMEEALDSLVDIMKVIQGMIIENA
ncbi:MAG: DUF47 family protein [Nitrospinota bacterium]|nr:DUF47 family protein [Nitrospinota bacterium]